MDRHSRRAMEMLAAAPPKSGYRPETEEEWRNVQRALEELGFAMFVNAGAPEEKARKAAHEIYGGLAGRVLMQIGYWDDDKK